MSDSGTLITRKPCSFCGLTEDNELQYGKFYEYDDITTHYYCLLLSSNMHQRGNDNEGILGFLAADIHRELRRGKKLVCTYCKKYGATLGCCNSKCKRVFHYPCGLKAGSLSQFFGEFKTFCMRHRLKQRIDRQILQELTKADKANCCICYDHVDPYNKIDTLWAPCCKKNAWFHRKCVQQLALSAGYFFKCPLCNDKKRFQQAMLDYGIFIPSQDASWELVPNAFEELLYRHDQCDAPTCVCPKGRKHTSLNAKWELVLCRTCGSQGVHMACAQLKWANPVWECDECKCILGKFNGSTSTATTSGENRNLTDDVMLDVSDSDSESVISVGNDSTTQFASSSLILTSLPEMVNYKERPGPRTYKLRQRLEAERKLQQARLAERKEFSEDASEQRNASCENNVTSPVANSSLESQSQVDVSTDDDSDIIEVTKCSSLVDEMIFGAGMRESSLYLSDATECNETNIVNGSSVADSSNIEIVDLEELSSQDEILSDDDSLDSMPNIKITNVISLAHVQFENTSVIEQDCQVNDVNTTSQNDDKLITVDPIISPPEEDSTESDSKRKLNDTMPETTTSIEVIPCTSQSKKLKLESTNSIMSKEGECVPGYVPLDANENALNENNSQSNSDINPNASSDALISKTDTLPYNNFENCDGDAGTRPASGTGKKNNMDHTRINSGKRVSRSCSRMSRSRRKSKTSARHERKCENNTNMRLHDKFDCWRQECQSKNCDHSRLIPEYIRLGDLKFRAYDTNDLQMILFNEFLVNIKMNHPDTIFDEPVKDSNEQNEIKDETFSNVKPGNILQDISHSCHKDKSKTVFTDEDYQDDTKENMDPVTIPYKNDINLLTNPTVITNNVNTQSENENLKPPICNIIKDDEDRNNENSLVEITDGDVKGSSNKRIKINFSPRSVQRVLFQETSMEQKSKSKFDIKVSIDLQKVQSFMDNNPGLFLKRKKEANEQSNEQSGFLKERNNIKQFAHSSGHNSVADRTNNIETFTLRLPKYKTIETEAVKSIEEGTMYNTRRTSNSFNS